MRRVLSGRVADASRAVERFKTFFAGSPAVLDGALEPAGETVGKSPDGSLFGEVSGPPGSGGSDPGGSVLLGRVGAGVAGGGAATTSTVAEEWKDFALLAWAVAVSVICSPGVAALRTEAAAISSSLWPVGRAPTVQTLPLDFGHTVNRGTSTCATLPMATVTLTPLASVTVLQTEIS